MKEKGKFRENDDILNKKKHYKGKRGEKKHEDEGAIENMKGERKKESRKKEMKREKKREKKGENAVKKMV